VSAGAVLSKYLIRRADGHVFNPLNFGLAIAFLVLGSSRVEPLDPWWSPLDRMMIAAAVAMLAAILIAPQRTEFGVKVGILGALVILGANALTVPSGPEHPEALNRAGTDVAPDFQPVALPPVIVSPEVVDLKAVFGDESEIAATALIRDLETEATAIRTADPSLLTTVEM